MKIGIIDADLLGRRNHRFPNLALMKLSSYYKSNNNQVQLLTSYKHLENYSHIFLSKVFSDTYIPIDLNQIPNLQFGGSGFSFDKAQSMPEDIEHTFPDYHLYDDWINNELYKNKQLSRLHFKAFLDYSIGFTTRGCFRHCDFCVNKNYSKVKLHSSIEEFLDKSRKYICLLDDNIFGYSKYKDIFQTLHDTNKRFHFKQGLDIRLLTEKKADLLSKSKYEGDFIFAFDNIRDKGLIERKLELWRSYSDKHTKLYVLVAYESQDLQDIVNMFERIKILQKYNCVPYIMRYNSYKQSTFSRLYTHVARWCNQPRFFKKMSFREFCIAHPINHMAYKTFKFYENNYPDLVETYFDLKMPSY